MITRQIEKKCLEFAKQYTVITITDEIQHLSETSYIPWHKITSVFKNI